jgi:hypothetical protein
MKIGLLKQLFIALLLVGFPIGALAGPAPDMDSDGVPDVIDNCKLVSNASPADCDSDQDGYGNACDADYSQDNTVGVPDFGTFTGNFGVAVPAPFAVSDHNCDGTTGVPDFGTFTGTFGGQPGPSGLSCAGAAPCP